MSKYKLYKLDPSYQFNLAGQLITQPIIQHYKTIYTNLFCLFFVSVVIVSMHRIPNFNGDTNI